MKLFGVILDSIKINFYHVQGCFSWEICVPLERVGQTCQIEYTKVNLGQHKDKMIIIIVLKFN
jgi:hypothetical protein